MSKLAIDLTYQPVGGSLAQITEIINNIDSCNFSEVIFYLTNENRHLFDGFNSTKITFELVSFSIPCILTLLIQIVRLTVRLPLRSSFCLIHSFFSELSSLLSLYYLLKVRESLSMSDQPQINID